ALRQLPAHADEGLVAMLARAKSLLPRASRSPRALRGCVLASAAALTLSLLLGTTPASALVTEVSGTKVGLQPPEVARWWDGNGTFAGGTGRPNLGNAAVLSFADKGG